MTDPTITIPEGYIKTRMRWLWARKGCTVCGGNGEYLVNDNEDTGEPWDPEDGPIWYPQPCDCLWSPPDEDLRKLDAAQTRVRRHREAMRSVLAAIGPREVSGTYWCGDWHRWYLVERIDIRFREGDLTAPTWSITIRWDNGDRSTHCTPWNPDRDGALHVLDPPGPAPAPPELRHLGELRCRCSSIRRALFDAAHAVVSRFQEEADVRCCSARLR